MGKKASVQHSVLTQGCCVEGTVENSVLSAGVTIAEGAKVAYSVLMPGVKVEPGAVVEYAIVGEGAVVGPQAKVGGDPAGYDPDQWGIAVLGPATKIGAGEVVAPKKMMNRDHEEVSR